MRLRLALSAFALIAASFSSLQAQKKPKEIRRPKLPAEADSNSAADYFFHGMQIFAKRPQEAGDAFYWSTRIDPSSAEPMYARRMAYFLAEPRIFFDYLRRAKYLEKNAQMQQMDSLLYKAMLRDPFIRTRLDKDLWDLIYEKLTGGQDWLEWSGSADPAYNGWLALNQGRYGQAVEHYSKAIKRWPKEDYYHHQRARAFYYLGNFDSAAAEMSRAVEKAAQRDAKQLVWFYESKAMYHYAMGHALLMASNVDGAKTAFSQALSEDLAFYMAHIRLGAIAMQAGDTATALNEYELAVQLREDDPVLRYEYAVMLIRVGKYEEALAHLKKAVEAEPYYMPPYVPLALLEETAGNTARARELLETYVARAPRGDRLLGAARTKLAELAAPPK